MNNAYATDNRGGRKFIGGAAMARRKAVKRGNRILLPGEKVRSEQPLPSEMLPYEKFFACLLRSTPSELAARTNCSSHDVWRTICNRARLRPPQHHVLPSYPYRDHRMHFDFRAALVLEEARQAIADGLAGMNLRQKKRNVTKHSTDARGMQSSLATDENAMGNSDRLGVILKMIEIRRKTEHAVCSFHKPTGPFGPSELLCLRSGTVMACVQSGEPFVTNNIRIGVVLPFNREDVLATRKFPVMFFEPTNVPLDSEWELEPIAQLLSECRKFEACTSCAVKSVPFLYDLLGGRSATHTRFTNECKTSDNDVVDLTISDGSDDEDSSETSSLQDQESFDLPILNDVQERAASKFLKSTPNAITLIQGPPGTGKTTLLVSVICRRILESIAGNTSGCLMVCAPTNKAITVLSSRFLEAVKSKDLPVNVVLVGDDDKLFENDLGGGRSDADSSRLRPIFLYTWTRTILEGYRKIRKFLTSKQPQGWDSMGTLATSLERRLRNQLSSLSKEARDATKKIAGHMNSESSRKGGSHAAITNAIDRLLNEIQTWKNDSIWHQIICSAHVIFCTLSSAGTQVLKKATISVDDLIVDEAAAATEPELYIPFQFSPKRLLAVGDPRQLPATVLSQRAVRLGLSKSLHERLMYDCDKDYVMLTVQYRMKPAISQFPGIQFYDDKIENSASVVSPEYDSPTILKGASYSFVHVHGKEQQKRSGSFENYAEAQAVVAMVEQLRQLSHLVPGKWHSADRIRVITFYQAQVHLIKRLLKGRQLHDTVVGTVDSSQGCEADIVILSFVRSNGGGSSSTVGFLSDDRRLNVALTRARHQLISVGNIQFMTTLKNSSTMWQLSSDAIRRDCVVPWAQDSNEGKVSKRPKKNFKHKNSKRQRVESCGSGGETSDSAPRDDRFPRSGMVGEVLCIPGPVQGSESPDECATDGKIEPSESGKCERPSRTLAGQTDSGSDMSEISMSVGMAYLEEI